MFLGAAGEVLCCGTKYIVFLVRKLMLKLFCQEVTDTRTLIVSLFLAKYRLCFTDPHLRQFSTVFAYVLYIRSIDKHTMSIERMDFVLRRNGSKNDAVLLCVDIIISINIYASRQRVGDWDTNSTI